MRIDPRFIDVDFEVEAVANQKARGWRGPGPDSEMFASAQFATIPESKWLDTPNPAREGLLDHYHLDQGPEPSCTANSAANGFNAEWRETFGVENAIVISPISLYNHCGTPSSGSSTSCIMKQLRDVGGLPIDNEANKAVMRRMGLDTRHVLPQRGVRLRPSSWPSGWQETAAHFRLAEVYQVKTYEEFGTALLRGFALSYGREGHAICAIRLVRDGNRWLFKYKNSWNKDWGDQGYGYDTATKIRKSLPYVYAYRAVRVTDATKNLIKPPA